MVLTIWQHCRLQVVPSADADVCAAHCDAMAPACVGFVAHEASDHCWLKSCMDENCRGLGVDNRDAYVAEKKKGKHTGSVLLDGSASPVKAKYF